MNTLVLTTYDWVPQPPRGFVRDLRVRWALGEAGLPYTVASTPFAKRGPEHLAVQEGHADQMAHFAKAD
jgi:glutathione S-transferase